MVKKRVLFVGKIIVNVSGEVNTFEYKKRTYGWNKQQFDEYNKSRAITKKNLTKNIGEIESLIKLNEYLQKQHYTKTLDYYVEKYGKEKGLAEYKRVCNEKLLTKENFIRKYR